MRPLLLIALVCLLSVLLLPSGLPTAQASYTRTITFDDALNDHPWTFGTLFNQGPYGTVGTGETGQGGVSVSPTHSSVQGYCCADAVIIRIPTDQECTIEGISFRERSTSSRWLVMRLYNASNALLWSYTSLRTTNFNVWLTVTPPLGTFSTYEPSSTYLDITIGTAATGHTNRIDDITLTCAGDPPIELIRPFSLVDEYIPTPPLTDPAMTDYAGFWDCNGDNLDLLPFLSCATVTAQSLSADASVMAAGDGVIASITPFSASAACKTLQVRLLFDDKTCLYFLPNPDPFASSDGWVTEELDNAYFVNLQLDNGDIIIYLVNDANRYVHVGLRVEAGCILGKAIARQAAATRLKGPVSALLAVFGVLPGLAASIILPDNPYSAGVTFMWRLQDGVGPVGSSRLLNDLTEYADPTLACNVDPLYANCLTNNPTMLRDGDGWSSIGTVSWNTFNGRGVSIPAQSGINQVLALNEATEYTVTFDIIGEIGGSSQAILQLGDLIQEVTINPLGNSVILQGVPQPDYGTLTTLSLTNIGPPGFYVQGICVVEGDVVPPLSCGVNNPTFDFTIAGWNVSNPTVQWRGGAAYVPKTQSILQDVTLAEGTYTLELDVRASLDFLTYTSGDGLSINVYYPNGTSGNIPVVANWNLPGQPGYPNLPQRLTATFTLGSALTGNLRFEPVLTEPDSSILGVLIDRVCLTRGSPEGGGGPFTPVCEKASIPENNELGAWTAWHWHNQYRFFSCELMVFLNTQYKFFQDTARTSFMATRWFMSTITYTSNWAGTDLFPWLGGHFRNIAVGQVTTVNQEGNAGFWDVLIAIIDSIIRPILDLILWIIGEAARLLLWLIQSLLGLVLQIISLLLNVILMGMQVLTSLIAAFNAAPITPISNLPQCGLNPQSHGFCIALWILENTIFSGPGALMIPLIVGISSIHLLIWVLAEYQRLIRRVGMLS